MTQGACLCGAVRYEVDGPFRHLTHCHCSMCRKHHGAAFATFAGAPLAGFRWLSGRDQLVSYQSSKDGERFFCRVCGSVTPMSLPKYGLVFCPAGNLRGDLGIKPELHTFVASKAPWYTITDGLPQHAEYPPEFEMAGMPRPAVSRKDGVVQGSCLCGDVTFEITGPPKRMMNCHCTRCRRGRSAAHASNIFYDLDSVRWTRSETQVAEYKLPEARFFGKAFCRRCGSGLPRLSRERGAAVVPAGSLDDDPGIRPAAHIFVASKASWFEITDGAPQFPEAPPTL